MKNVIQKLIKKIKSNSIISALVLSAVGSALWEWILSPLANICFEKILVVLSDFASTYSDSIYYQISNGFSESYDKYIVFFGVGYILSVLISSIDTSNTAVHKTETLMHAANKFVELETANPEDLKTIHDSISNDLEIIAPSSNKSSIELASQAEALHSKAIKTKRKIVPLVTGSIFFIVWFLMQSSYINFTVTALTNNIEIVSPYISDLEYKHLKSSFHSMDSRDDYDALCTALSNIAESNDLKLK